MSDNTPNLDLALIAAGQAQKHVTHNEALLRLDRLCQLAVKSRNEASPPASPVLGDAYLVLASNASAWGAAANQLVHFTADGWLAETQKVGTLLWLEDEGAALAFSGSGWVGIAAQESAGQFGVNTLADASNKLAVKSDYVLLSHDDVTPGSGSIQAKLNKSGTASTASFLFQNNYSGRAEFGLIGEDNFALKVSSDGSTFEDAIRVGASDGGVEIIKHLATPLQKFTNTSLADDTVHDANLPSGGRDQGLLALGSDDFNLCALLAFDLGSSPSILMMASTDPSLFSLSTSLLSGTTGPSGKLGLSARVGKIQIENRTGASREFRLLFLG